MDKAALKFVWIRSIQVRRELVAAGLIRAAILVFLTLSVVYLFGFSQLQDSTAFYGVLGALAVVLILHFTRNDHMFIRHHVRQFWQVYFAEYVAASLVLIITGLLLGSWRSLLLLPGIAVISFIPVASRANATPGRFTGVIPLSLFEWRAGLRKNRIMFLVLYLAMVVLMPLPYITIALSWLLVALISSFYLDAEGREIIEAGGNTASGFLSRKMFIHLAAVMLVAGLPLLLHGLFCHRELLFVIIALFMIAINSMLFVVTKYAFWTPGGKGGAHEIVFSLAVMSILIPFLLPIPFFFLIRNYFKAKSNLRTVFHD